VRTGEIPPHLREQAQESREVLIDAASMFSDELTEAALEEPVTPALLSAAVRKGVQTREITPVFMGSAYKNKAVQPLLDAVNQPICPARWTFKMRPSTGKRRDPCGILTDNTQPIPWWPWPSSWKTVNTVS
jgi:translation elongation factor EF-G